jgi:hypothetical protein
MEWLAKENSDIDLSKVRACALFTFFLVIFNPSAYRWAPSQMRSNFCSFAHATGAIRRDEDIHGKGGIRGDRPHAAAAAFLMPSLPEKVADLL